MSYDVAKTFIEEKLIKSSKLLEKDNAGAFPFFCYSIYFKKKI